MSEQTSAAGLPEITLPSGDRMRVVGRHADVLQVLTDPGFTRDLRQVAGTRMVRGDDISDDHDSLLNMDPPRHTRLRRIVAGAFAPRQVASWRPRVTEICQQLAADMAAHGSPADLVSSFAFPLPMRVICELLGVPEADRDRFRAWSEAALSMSNSDAERRATAGREFRGYVADLVAEHRRTPGTALIDDLLSAHDDSGALSEAELVSLIINLITAGHETTASLIATGVFTLLSENIYREPAVTPAPESLFEELLRHDTPARYGMPRVALKDVDLPSGRVRQGETVLPLLAEANRDPDVYPDADRFEPERFEPARSATPHVTFGHGPHFCLGAGLARLEVHTALTVLLTRFPNLDLAEPAPDIPWRENGLVTGPTRLPVRW